MEAGAPSAAPVTPWIPQDDLLLKNAVEAGASLEALAKGAVRFSRRYTLQELQDRWHSLLYDTDTATQASACILELAGSAFSIPSKANPSYIAKEREMELGKRKAQTIRSQYSLVRKKLRAEFFSSTDLGFLAGTSLHSCANGSPVDEKFVSGSEDVLACPVDKNLGSEDVLACPDSDDRILPGHAVIHSWPLLTDEGGVDGFASITMSDADLANLSDSLLYFSKEDGILPRKNDRNNSVLLNELSTSGSASKHQELNPGHMYCTLNTEDPDIPCNDDIFLDKAPTQTVGKFLKPALPRAPRRAKKAIGGSTRRKPVDNGMGKIDKIPLHAGVGGAIETTLPQSVVKPSSDEEEPDSESDGLFFSDIEAMILEKDLDLQDEDFYFSRLVSRYQNDDSKRKIIKLEQGAQSALQRTLACQGALAVLYGRHLRHFINKTEVILGRSTSENNVDIDLGEEGHANKISRKQAMIKMGQNGSFFLKNIGKAPIFVNGRAVVMGQSLRLGGSCLLEMRGMNFVFETDSKIIRQYLDKVAKGSKCTAQEPLSATKEP